MHEPAGAMPPREVGQLVQLPARHPAAAGRHDAAHAAAGGDRLGEHAEVDAADGIGQVDQLHAEAQVGLVRSVSVHGVGVLEAREGLLQERVLRKDLPGHPGDHALDGVEHVLLGDEAHLDVDLRVLRLPIAAQILVTEGAGQLVVAVVARDHQQLLQHLRALGQRVELAGAQPRRHHEVAGALGRGADQVRRLDLDEAIVFQRAANRAGQA